MKENILKNIKLSKAVIEIDEVEYLINEKAAKQIIDGEKLLVLIRLVDQEKKLIPIEWIVDSISKKGVIDYLD